MSKSKPDMYRESSSANWDMTPPEGYYDDDTSSSSSSSSSFSSSLSSSKRSVKYVNNNTEADDLKQEAVETIGQVILVIFLWMFLGSQIAYAILQHFVTGVTLYYLILCFGALVGITLLAMFVGNAIAAYNKDKDE